MLWSYPDKVENKPQASSGCPDGLSPLHSRSQGFLTSIAVSDTLTRTLPGNGYFSSSN
ncbi:hypothetical protein M378DRAFT_316423 [Amanita muscaria Koide BX008]|uniref:Uncharacterized protein n=1 Tax=Amanita muscaria (strain Koide BX008) TaxID=946122 RepID=A0A0C2WNZ1_AMAMK|nr:hypothetical protein M378DRAFT_316423 [Amanita muscaria Koide BX008]